LSNYDRTVFHLAKQGYGTLSEIKELDTKDFLDLLEYEQINNDLEWHHIQGK